MPHGNVPRYGVTSRRVHPTVRYALPRAAHPTRLDDPTRACLDERLPDADGSNYRVSLGRSTFSRPQPRAPGCGRSEAPPAMRWTEPIPAVFIGCTPGWHTSCGCPAKFQRQSDAARVGLPGDSHGQDPCRDRVPPASRPTPDEIREANRSIHKSDTEVMRVFRNAAATVGSSVQDRADEVIAYTRREPAARR